MTVLKTKTNILIGLIQDPVTALLNIPGVLLVAQLSYKIQHSKTLTLCPTTR